MGIMFVPSSMCGSQSELVENTVLLNTYILSSLEQKCVGS